MTGAAGALRITPSAVSQQTATRWAAFSDVTPSAATAKVTASPPATEQNGTGMRGLLRLGRAKAEPEPQDDVPAAKVVRQQPVRQAKSKRSGKR